MTAQQLMELQKEKKQLHAYLKAYERSERNFVFYILIS